MLTATDQRRQKNHQKVITLIITSPESQRDAEKYHLLIFFAVFGLRS